MGKSIGFVAASAKPKIKLLKLKFFLLIMIVLIVPNKLFKNTQKIKIVYNYQKVKCQKFVLHKERKFL